MLSGVKRGFLTAFIVVMISVMACGANAAEFKADMTMGSDTAGEMTGRVFVKGNALRQELDTAAGPQVTIIEQNAKVMYVILPGQKMYMEIQNNQITLDEDENIEAKLAEEGTVTKKGTEDIEGYTCDVYHIVYNDSSYGESTVWISKDLNYPLKVYMESPQDTVTILYTNIEENNVDPALFKLPSGYTKFSM